MAGAAAVSQSASLPPPAPYTSLAAIQSAVAGANNQRQTTSNSASSRISTTSNNTYVMSRSPAKNSRRKTTEPYQPKIITTVGQRPACLVNASVTYVGNDMIYAFGGFDQYTDEVYNHVLKLSLNAKQWSLVDNYGDIPGVRMGHTSCLWQGDKLLVYGGENEHRIHLSDVVIFDIKTAHWTQPDINGPIPRGRARHSAVIHDDKLFICGGMTGNDNAVLDDICFLDLKTWTWSRTWRFVARYDHSSWVWGGKIWVSGGMSEEMERSSEIWWLDFRGTPAFEGGPTYGIAGSDDGRALNDRYNGYAFPVGPQQALGTTGYAANTSSVQSNSATQIQRNPPPVAPGAISSIKFISSPNLPIQNVGTHFHVFSSGCMLDFVTPATNMPLDASLSALDLDTLRWQKLADGKDLLPPTYRWHYCCLDADGTHAWLLGCPREPPDREAEEYLSDVLPIDLRKFGLLGNKLSQESRNEQRAPTSDSYASSHLSAIGADLARTFNQPPESGAGTDFTITALRDDDYDMEDASETGSPVATSSPKSEASSNHSPPIHVHRLILSARWPHFSRLYNAQMQEFHSRRMHIPEPYPAVKAFLYYLYTDSISSPPAESNAVGGPTLEDVANMLVMSNIYDMPRLRHLCVNRLVRDLDVQHAALIFDRASTAQEDWLKRRAASFCMTHWGRVVRTDGFRGLKRSAMLELCEGVDTEGRVVGGDELEAVGGLGGARLGSGMGVLWGNGRKRGRVGSTAEATVDGDADEADGDGDEAVDDNDEGMEIS